MNITNELREWLSNRAFLGYGYAELIAIADRIDEKHKHAIGYVDDHDPDTMTENGWIRLPKDADGEYIHVGDVLTDDAEFESEGKVVRLMFENEGWLIGFDERVRWAEPSIHEWHHYHTPTVEDILKEFTDAILEWSGKSGTVAEVGTWSDIAAEYAAKLQLAEEKDT